METYALYKIWLGIQYFWGPDGPVERRQYPHPTSNNLQAQSALTLKQNTITDNKTAISGYLVPIVLTAANSPQ
jgi:hypothetical protein